MQCAEGIGKYLLPYLPFKIPKKLLKWPIKGMSFWAEDITVERKGGMWEGYSINREEFDKWLAFKAVKAGADLFLESNLIDLETNNDYTVKKAIVKTNHGIKEIEPNVVIAADGVESTVLRLLGFKIDYKKTGYVYGLEIKNIKLRNPNIDQIYIGNFAPGGYGYLFPTSNNTANVGIAVLGNKKNIYQSFNDFIGFLKIDKSKIGINKSGLVPFLNQTNKWNYGNILLVGDAANQNFKPFVEGYVPAIVCGHIAGKSSKYPYQKYLDQYERNVLENFSDLWHYSNKMENAIIDLKNENKKFNTIKLGLLTEILDINEYQSIKNCSYNKILRKLGA